MNDPNPSSIPAAFDASVLLPQLQKALTKLEFEIFTPIQQKSIPYALEGRDVLATAPTGSGKTAAFAIPLLTQLFTAGDRCAVILVPTRELAAQVTGVVRKLALFMPKIRTIEITGGVQANLQLRALSKGFQILVATPGRLADHLDRGNIKLENLNTLVLDEADRMLDLGFAPQLEKIFSYLPETRQTLMFSATMPKDVVSLSRQMLFRPAEIAIAAKALSAPKIEQRMLEASGDGKTSALLHELNTRKGSVIVFLRTQKRADMVTEFLESQSVQVRTLHGGKSQGVRVHAMKEFTEQKVRILVATDVAARGLDIKHVDHVINFDVPENREDYIHRIGRTARAGRSGSTVTFVSHEEMAKWLSIKTSL